ncbi:MAG: hypothetical protein U0Y96_06295 [Candidatus Kapaibacterium sp.]
MADSITYQSLDPRVTRMHIPTNEQANFTPLDDMNHWQTYEVFHQAKTGGRHIHVGSVHAPNAEMALLYAKEQFGRRSVCVNMWVVKTQDILSLATEDADVFATTPEKDFREASGYKVMSKLNAYKKLQKEANTAKETE